MKFEAEKMKLKEERERMIRNHWENLPKINNPEDVPTLPRVDEKEWREFYVPKLIDAGAIPKKDLVNDDCNHFEDDDGFALFVPIRLGTQEEWDERIK